MAKLKVDQFVELVKRSGLVDNERLNQALSGVDESIRDSGIVASNLTKAGLLTEWQSEKLLQGRHKGFYLGKYKLLNHIGTGGMGSVYLAEHRVMRHRVAIKLLPNHLAAHKSYLERFHQEARASAQLNHPNMVRAYDVDHEENLHYLVMEFVDGMDLQAVVSRNGPFSYRVAADYTRQAADGLAYAHKMGLIHRDIKPANLLIDKTGTIKILDMGLARFSDETQGSLTMAYDQKMIGTVDYLAPEQALDSHKVDARADIYSLGCTLYFMLSGDAPFPQGTIPQRLLQHQSGEPVDIGKIRSDVPDELIAICSKMMAKSPSDRYQSAAEVSQAISAWLGDSELDEADDEDDGPQAAAAAPGLKSSSENEDLTLAPLDDDPATRGIAKAAKESKAGDSKANATAPAPEAKKPGASGIKTGDSSSVTKAAKSPAAPSPAKSTPPSTRPSTAKSPAGQAPATKPPAGKSNAGASARLPELSREDDLMDELLSDPTLATSTTSADLLTGPRRFQPEDRVLPVWRVIGLGVLGGAIVVAILLVVAWLTGRL